ncbi:hypothetical protein PTI98_007604 [Pleurotus ostreatus]|nr:hypothetical protein PTI98_007604 [Pleurotus ostreatus]
METFAFNTPENCYFRIGDFWSFSTPSKARRVRGCISAAFYVLLCGESLPTDWSSIPEEGHVGVTAVSSVHKLRH